MGFYAPAQIVRDAREHGVEVRPVDINHSDYEERLERGPRGAEHLHEMPRDMVNDVRARYAVRLGLQEVKGLAEEAAKRIVARRGAGYVSLRDLWLRTALSPKMIARLADADAFFSEKLSRRKALWAAKALGRAGDQDALPVFGPQSTADAGPRGVSDSPFSAPPSAGPVSTAGAESCATGRGAKPRPASGFACRASSPCASGRARPTASFFYRSRTRPRSPISSSGRTCSSASGRSCSARAMSRRPAACRRNPASFMSSPKGSRI